MAFAMPLSDGKVFEVGAFDAKTYFSDLLRKVQGGATVNISKNGKQVAVLKGVQSVKNSAALEAHERILARSKKFAAMRKNGGFDAISAAELKELKDAGRKY